MAGLKGKPLQRNIFMEEVRQHKTREDCWLVYAGKVHFRITNLLSFGCRLLVVRATVGARPPIWYTCQNVRQSFGALAFNRGPPAF